MTKEMNLIFNLQLFADDDPVKKVLFTKGAADSIIITVGAESPNDSVISVYQNGSIASANTLSVAENETVAGFNAAGGADKITVGTGFSGLTIAGGGGNEYITIDSGSEGNFYSIASGQGKDSIYGWDATKDTLQIGSAIASSFMSNDGKDLTIKFASGEVKLVGVGSRTSPTDKKIKVLDAEGEIQELAVPYKMEDVAKLNVITNTDQGSPSTLKNGTATTALTIDGGAGNDSIINEGSYVYIDGGAGKDQITVQAQGVAAANDETSDNTRCCW